MNWDSIYKAETVEDMLEIFHDEVQRDPKQVLSKLALDLETLYVRFDNNQEQRGLVGDCNLLGQITGLEAVRAECITLLKERGEWPPKRN